MSFLGGGRCGGFSWFEIFLVLPWKELDSEKHKVRSRFLDKMLSSFDFLQIDWSRIPDICFPRIYCRYIFLLCCSYHFFFSCQQHQAEPIGFREVLIWWFNPLPYIMGKRKRQNWSYVRLMEEPSLTAISYETCRI